MNFRTTAKWMFFLFCIITTAQLIYIVFTTVVFEAYNLSFRLPISALLDFMIISLASSLPLLILTQCKILSWIPINIRRALHFFMTFGIVNSLLIRFGFYEASAWLLLPLILFLIVYSLAIFSYQKYIVEKAIAQKDAEDQRQLQLYTDELERYQLSVRKFKHDYQNILLSLDAYIADGDLADLRDYYNTSVKPASDIITKSNFALDGLDKIKIRVIKSFLTAKLMLAQNTDMGISVVIEANEDIQQIPLDLTTFIRMAGILLDNAVEELTELGHGELFVSFLNLDNELVFIVSNTCRSNLPSPKLLWQPGFSSKGKDRGLGLHNLSELVNACSNVTLSTKINENTFRQELSIRKGT